MQPSVAHRKGDALQRGDATHSARSGSWVLSSEMTYAEDWDLDNAIVDLLAQLPAEPAVWSEVHRLSTADIFCGLFMGVFNQGTDIRASTLALLSQRGLALSLDVYGP